MNLEGDMRLSYLVGEEAWYTARLREGGASPHRNRAYITVGSTPVDGSGGCEWEFTIEARPEINGGTVRIKMFNDSFAAYRQVPELFETLAADSPRSLDQVRAILDRIGAVDETPRVDPYVRA